MSPSDPAADEPATSRRARKKERTRQEIFRAAMDLFREKGFDAVTIEAICSAADVARGTFFLHFPTKSALLSEFNRQITEDFARRIESPEREGAVEELTQLVDLISERLLADADVMSAMLREFFTTPLALLEAPPDAQDLPDLVERIVIRGQERGELRSDIAPRLAVATFLSTSCAILAGGVFDPEKTRPEEARRQFLTAVFHGLAHS